MDQVKRGLETMCTQLGEAADSKHIRKLGHRLHHAPGQMPPAQHYSEVLQELGREALETYLMKCVVPQMKNYVQTLQQVEKLPEEEKKALSLQLVCIAIAIHSA